MKVTEMVPNKKVVWHVLDNYFSFTQDKSEWKGTTLSSKLRRRVTKQKFYLTHVGLVSANECYDVCSNAWGSYINGSLRNLIATGKGKPNPKE